MKDFFFAHKGNLYKPHIFAAESVMAMALALFIFEGLYVFQIGVVAKDARFTAAVLPAALTALTNADRSARGLGVLQSDPLLDQAAQEKAQDMAAGGYFAHVSPSGKTPWYWLNQMGYQYAYAGENLAVDFVDSSEVETAWMNSPSHRDNIVRPEYTRIGMAVAQGMYQGKQATFVVELFATPVATPALAAVSDDVPQAPAPIPRRAAKVQTPRIESHAHAGAVLGTRRQDAPPTPIAVATPPAPQPQRVSVIEAHTVSANPLVQAAAEPTQTSSYLFVSFIMIILFLLGMAFAVHARLGIQYVEIVGSGAIVAGIAIVFLFLNGKTVHPVGLPSDGQSASVAVSVR